MQSCGEGTLCPGAPRRSGQNVSAEAGRQPHVISPPPGYPCIRRRATDPFRTRRPISRRRDFSGVISLVRQGNARKIDDVDQSLLHIRSPRPEYLEEKAMRTKLWSLGLLIAVLGFVVGASSVSVLRAAASSGAASGETTHLHFLVKFIGQDTFLHLGTAPGPSQGDEEILHDLVFTPDGSTQVGYDGGMCSLFDLTKPEENCTVTFSLPGGDIMTQFFNSPPPAKTFAVTGGTGIYRNVRGQGELVESGHETATLSFDLIGG
jgi:hypothetical protein